MLMVGSPGGIHRPTGVQEERMARKRAVLGIARMGATRLGDVGSNLALQIDGVSRSNSFDRTNWRINERPVGQANTAYFEVFGFTPTVGDEVAFGHGTIRNPLFKGKIASVNKIHKRL